VVSLISYFLVQGPEEPLLDAQMRKINHLIDKARVESTHEVLEIGFGWGALAIQLVRRTGCRYIGITLSKEQLTFAQAMVKEACLEVLVLRFHTFFSFFTKTTHLNLSYAYAFEVVPSNIVPS
jgi:cyclopropane fatty-acyl-phospholipid synthase-like methyltransferase